MKCWEVCQHPLPNWLTICRRLILEHCFDRHWRGPLLADAPWGTCCSRHGISRYSESGLPFSDRLSILDSAFVPSEKILLCENFPGPAARFVAAVRKLGGEGVVGKRLDSRYEPGKRSGAWVKVRLNLGQEFVIGGFTPGAIGFDSLVVGFYEGKKLLYVARVRAGFVPASRRDVFARLKPLITTVCPFVNLPEARSGRWGQGLTAEKMRDCIWVLCRIRHSNHNVECRTMPHRVL